MRITIFTLFLFSFCEQVIAQTFIPGYIISNDGDSIPVLLKDRLPLPCFQEAITKKDGLIREYTSHDIQAYGYLGSKRFEVFEIEGEKVFLQLLVSGKLSFYQGLKFYYIKEQELIRLYNFQPNESEYYPSFKTILNSYFSNCPHLTSDHIKYTEKEITNLVTAYNECKTGNAGIVLKKKYPQKTINFAVKLGVTSSQITSFETKQDWEIGNPNQSTAFMIGAGIDFSSPKNIKRLFGTLETYFEKNYSKFRIPNKEVELDVYYLKIPLGLRYHIFLRDNTPYLGFGYLLTLAINSHQSVVYKRDQNPYIYTVNLTENSTWFQSGIFATVGYQQVLFNKMKLSFEIRYAESTGRISWPVDSQIHVSELNMLIGIRY